jgi:hypothetical protein
MKTSTTDPNRETISGLARLVQCDRKTIRNHLARDGAPARAPDGTYERNSTVRFLRGVINKGGSAPSLLEDLRAKRLQLEIEKVTFDLSVQRGEYYRRTVAAPVFAAMTAGLVADLQQKFEMELPARCVGKGQVEIAQLNAAAVDFIIARFIAGQKPLTADQPAPQ